MDALIMYASDDVAMVLDDCEAGAEVVLRDKNGAIVGEVLHAAAAIPQYHKIAVNAVEQGSYVHKYGERIGRATQAFAPGDYVHVHNIESYKTEGSAHAY